MISKKNIQVNKNYEANNIEFFMCNLFSKTPKIHLSKVKNCIFNRCNLYGCEIDETNTLIQSNIIDTTPMPPELTIEDQLQTSKNRVIQLEEYIKNNGLSIPVKT